MNPVLQIKKMHERSRDSSVGIATGCGLDDRASIYRQGEEIFLRSTACRPVQTGSEAHLASCSVGTGGNAARA
jgi:hypothetical protein